MVSPSPETKAGLTFGKSDSSGCTSYIRRILSSLQDNKHVPSGEYSTPFKKFPGVFDPSALVSTRVIGKHAMNYLLLVT